MELEPQKQMVCMFVTAIVQTLTLSTPCIMTTKQFIKLLAPLVQFGQFKKLPLVTSLYSSTGGAIVPEGIWTLETDGNSPAPIVQALSEIGEAIGYWGSAKWEGNDPISLTAYPDSNGIRVASNVTGTVYVAYKKAWSDTYGNGESGTLATVPSEWAEFMAYDAARSYRASQDSESGFNPIALRDVNNALERALMKPSREGAIAALTNQLKTQYSTDNSV